ncbi:MAG: hypothetical protein V7L20_14490 [Nostoc sp.]|uniref:hypothetical protein n=1 Tax=Nostoc sp. TaxID=1180 RepID=UPI002FF9F31D
MPEQESAMAIAFALALDTENIEIQQRQIAWLREVQPAELVEKTLELSSQIRQLNPIHLENWSFTRKNITVYR